MRLKAGLALFVAVAIIALACASLDSPVDSLSREGIGRIDLLQYWGAAKLFLEHENPYDGRLLADIQRQVSAFEPLPVLMWNPPNAFPIIVSLGLISFQTAVTVVFLCGILFVGASYFILCRGLRCEPMTPLPLLFLVTFYPVGLSLFYGQITPILLLGLSGYIAGIASKEPQTSHKLVLSGACLSLVTLKPHLLYLPCFYLLLNGESRSSFRAAAGFVSISLLLILVPGAWEGGIYEHYREAMTRPPLYWQTPTVGSFIQGWTSEGFYRFAPAALGLIALIWFRARGWTPPLLLGTLLLIPLSLVTSPYGWVYDQMLLLPCALYTLANFPRLSKIRRAAASALLFGANVLMMLIPGEYGQQVHVWYPLAFFAALVLVKPLAACPGRSVRPVDPRTAGRDPDPSAGKGSL